jgi:hypothetical protein
VLSITNKVKKKMGAIATTDARGLFTKMVVDVFRESVTPTGFLRSFFTVREEITKNLSIEVQRGTEKIAVDVERGTEGNRNTWTKSTEKIFAPPYYREYFDATELDMYDRLFGSTEIDSGVFTAFLEQVAEKMVRLREKIERSYELQCAQVFDNGIVQLNAGINIDFKRKAASLVNLSATPWTTGTNSPYDHLEAGGNFLRQTGKVQGGVINAIMGSSALNAFLNNTIVKERADVRNFFIDLVRAPQKNSVGAALHGEVSAGSYNFRLWTYPEFYDTAAGVSTPYINAKKVILLPEAPRFVLGFAAVPQLATINGGVKKGAYLVGDYVDERNHKHIFDIRSAGVAIPVAVDQIYTMQVVA